MMSGHPQNRIRAGMAALGVAAVSALACASAQAGVVFSFAQVGNNVVLTGSGSYNLAGANILGTGQQDGFVNSLGGLAVGGPFGLVTAYTLTSNAGAFGTGGFVNGVPDSGDRFGLDVVTGFMTVYQGYVSGSALSGSTVFANQTFDSLGLNVGTYVYRIPNDTITVSVQVPEPATFALSGLALVAAALVGRRRQRA